MQEIKHNFTGGKMNKDVNERLIPKGEYRDAMNIQVSTSEGSDVGTVQNILGNSLITLPEAITGSDLDFTCVGTIADEKTDSSYWFLKGPEKFVTDSGRAFQQINFSQYGNSLSKDYILRLRNNEVEVIFTDTKDIVILAQDLIQGSKTTDALDPLNKIIQIPNNFISGVSVGDTLHLIINSNGNYKKVNSRVIRIVTSTFSGGSSYIVLDQPFFTSASFGRSGSFTLVFKSNCLNFQGNYITGINIIDDLLIWTDNHNEPKMLSIERSRDNTNQTGKFHTKLYNPKILNLETWKKVEPHHIQVIKRKPTHALNTVKSTSRKAGIIYGEQIEFNFANDQNVILSDGYEGTINIYSGVSGQNCNYNKGDVLLLLNEIDQTNTSSNRSLPQQYDVRISITDVSHYNSGLSVVDFKIISTSSSTPLYETDYVSILFEPSSTLFEDEMFRFSYRYRYLDGQVSSFAPWSTTVFLPGNFKYDQKNAYNFGMLNGITDLTLNNFIDFENTLDVVSIDLLVKNENNPSVYLIDSVSRKDFDNTAPDVSGNPFGGTYTFNPKQIKSTLPENQLLRPWDNVPRKALAQEVTGNRLVYGNFLESYNFPSTIIDINPGIANRPLELIQPEDGNPSVKTQRNYQVGMVLVDKEGRESPILTSENANVDVPKGMLDRNIMLTASHSITMPSWVNAYKYYIKDSSKPAYNLVMDSFYKSEKGDFWISVPSSERNKLQEGDLIELKKGIDDNRPLLTPLKTKVIAIENEAPDFIKINYRKLGRSFAQWPNGLGITTYIFPSDGQPTPGNDYFKMEKTNWMENNNLLTGGGADLAGKELAFQFSAQHVVTGASLISKLYTGEVTLYTPTNPAASLGIWAVRLDERIAQHEDWMLDSTTTTGLNDQLSITIFEKEELPSSEFNGKFFMKIEAKEDLVDSILPPDIVMVQEQTAGVLAVRNFADAFLYFGDKTTNFGVTDGAAVDNTVYNGSTTTSAQAFVGRTDTIEKWDELLQYNATYQGATDYVPQYWFIDRVWYRRTQPLDAVQYAAGSSSPGNQFGLGIFKPTANQVVPQGQSVSFGQTPTYNVDPSGKSIGYLKQDKWYMEISLVGMMKSITYTAGGLFSFNTGVAPAAGVNGEDSAWDFRYRRKGYGTTGSGSSTYDSLQGVNDEFDPANHDVAMTYIPKKGTKFKWQDGAEVFTITDDPVYELRWNHTVVEDANSVASTTDPDFEAFIDPTNRRLTFIIELDKDPTAYDGIDPMNNTQVSSSNPINMVFLEQSINKEPGDPVLSTDNPAVFEVPQKDEEKLDVYYEASNEIPVDLSFPNLSRLIPVGSKVSYAKDSTILDINSKVIQISEGSPSEITVDGNLGDSTRWNSIVNNDEKLTFLTPGGDTINITFQSVFSGGTNVNLTPVSSTKGDSFNIGLSWSNCISFRNGVESVYLKDDFNEKFISKGAKVSSTINKEYEEIENKSRLIYSGIYNSTTDLNSLNQFITAEKITKDINPIYGSIQKLYSRSTADGDLITLCEDRILKILANKDAVFNADGNMQLTATNNVLGQAIPYSGDYGISKNPESFAAESYRCYFSDKVRGKIIRLSKDGLTPISDFGMKDWFRDNLKLSTDLLGSYDDKKDEYNVTLTNANRRSIKWKEVPGARMIATSVTFKEDVKGWVSFKSFVPINAISCANEYYTFAENSIWKHHDENTTRNSFYDNDSYSLPSHVEVVFNDSPGTVKSFKTINYEGSQAKVTKDTLVGADGYNEYFNLTDMDGWFVENITTNLEHGNITEFIEKEGKWFGYVAGDDVYVNERSGSVINNYDTEDFSIQGIGSYNGEPIELDVIKGCTCGPSSSTKDMTGCATTTSGLLAVVSTNVNCADITEFDKVKEWDCGCDVLGAANYNSLATVDDGSCVPFVPGCSDPLATNYNACANYGNQDELCEYYGCTEGVLADEDNWNFFFDAPNGDALTIANQEFGYINHDSNANINDGSCKKARYGCTDPTKYNYDVTANIAGTRLPDTGLGCGSPNCVCEDYVYGCTDDKATNYDTTVNTEDGSCVYHGCTDPISPDYDFALSNPAVDGPNNELYYENGIAVDDGSCTYPGGCTDSLACNYDANETVDNGSCYYCGDELAINYGGTVDAGCTANCEYCFPVEDFEILNTTTSDSGMSNGTIELQWVASITPSVTFYEIKWYTGNNTTLLGSATIYDTTTTNYTITDLPVGTFTVSIETSCSTNLGTAVAGDSETISGTTITNTTVYGCTDSTGTGNTIGSWAACNHDSLANTDDGSCVYDTCIGCNDSTYLEYCGDCWDSLNQVVVPNGGGNWVANDVNCVSVNGCCQTVIITGCTDSTAFNYNSNANLDDGSCIEVVNGCTGSTADNYNAAANTDDGTCVWLGCTNPIASNYSFGDSCTYWNSGSDNSGCTVTSGAQSYLTGNTIDNGTCIYNSGCTDVTASNYDPDATVDSGCLYEGCTDATASNYDSSANLNDGSCLYPGCTDVTACNYSFSDSCADPINLTGCTVTQAGDDYQNGTVTSNGTCTFPTVNQPVSVSACDSYTWLAADGGSGLIYATSGTYTHSDGAACSTTNTLVLTINESTNNVGSHQVVAFDHPYIWPANGQTYTSNTQDSLVTTNAAGCEHTELLHLTFGVDGCTNSTACNYNPLATCDDGSCYGDLPGCTDPNAQNYDPNATNDDGTCTYLNTPTNYTVRSFGPYEWLGTTYSVSGTYASTDSLWQQIGQDITGSSSGGDDPRVTNPVLNNDGTIMAYSAFKEDNGGNTNIGVTRVVQYNSSSNTWNQLGSDIVGEAANDESGYSVDLNSAGDVIAIGAQRSNSNRGHVRVYQYSVGGWSQVGGDIDGANTNDLTGTSISISDDGATVNVGAAHAPGYTLGSGYVRSYRYDGSSWNQLGQELAYQGSLGPGYNSSEVYKFGHSVHASSDGETIIVGAPISYFHLGSASIWSYNSSTSLWVQKGQEITGDPDNPNIGNLGETGYGVSMSSDGQTIVVGSKTAPRYGNKQDYEGSPPDYIPGFPEEIASNIISSTPQGHVRVYDYNTTSSTWVQRGHTIRGIFDESFYFGADVDISSDGNRVTIGAPFTNFGMNCVFAWTGSEWVRIGQYIHPASGLGSGTHGDRVSISGDGQTMAAGNAAQGNNAGRVTAYRMSDASVTLTLTVDPECNS